MKLWAISDLHLGHPANRAVLQQLPAHPADWLIVAGDVGETLGQLSLAWEILTPRFAQLLWVPGNHELWTLSQDPGAPRGPARYQELVDECRRYGVLTPEDPYPLWPGPGEPHRLAPLFLLYDYSFRPDTVPLEETLAWAGEAGIVCADESLLHPDPYSSRRAWCHARCTLTAQRLQALRPSYPLVLINHFPLCYDLVDIPAIPRFSPWCGTRLTEDWPRRFPVRVVVYGHLHRPGTTWRAGVRHEEVSLGYPRQWRRRGGRGISLRQILPAPSAG